MNDGNLLCISIFNKRAFLTTKLEFRKTFSKKYRKITWNKVFFKSWSEIYELVFAISFIIHRIYCVKNLDSK